MISKENTMSNLLDSDVPQIDTPILQPTKYKKLKRKYSKKGIYTKAEKLKKKITSIFDQFNKKPGRPKMSLEPQKSWYKKLKESTIDVFNNIHRKPVFILDKEALNVTKRYVVNLKKRWIIFVLSFKFVRRSKTLGV